MNVRNVIATAICGYLASGNLVMAQQNQQIQPRTQVQQTQVQGQIGQRTQWQNSDHMLASCVAIGNQEEVSLAKFAEQKAKSQQVKDFAKMLEKDHQEFLQKLQRFAPEATQAGYLMDSSAIDAQRTTSTQNRGNSQVQAREGNQPRERSTQVRVNPAGGEVNVATNGIQQTSAIQGQSSQPLDFMALHKELAENCLRLAKQGMAKKEGDEFDKCYIGQQIVKHEEMKNKLMVFERHSSSELNQILQAGLETTEKHLKKAEEIMKELDKPNSSNSKNK